jgi:hypothetical protein
LLIACVSATLVINEIDISQTSSNFNEFVELKNIGTTTINTLNYTLGFYDSGNQVDQQPLLDFDVAPGAYYVMCLYPSKTLLCTQEVKVNRLSGEALFSNWIANENSTVILFEQNTRVDLVGYAALAGMSSAWYMGTSAAPSDSVSWIGTSVSRTPDGSNTNDNGRDFIHTCRTPGRANSNLPASISCAADTDVELVINEVDYTQSYLGFVNDSREFIELHNRANIRPALTENTSLYRLRIIAADNSTVRTITVSGRLFPLTVPLHGYFTICAFGSGVCDGVGARNVSAAANATNGFLDTGLNWIPNPGDNGSPYFTIQLFKQSGATVIVQDTVTYGGTHPGYTSGTGAGDLDRAIESRYSLSRYPDSYDTKNSAVDWSARYVPPPPPPITFSLFLLLLRIQSISNPPPNLASCPLPCFPLLPNPLSGADLVMRVCAGAPLPTRRTW